MLIVTETGSGCRNCKACCSPFPQGLCRYLSLIDAGVFDTIRNSSSPPYGPEGLAAAGGRHSAGWRPQAQHPLLVTMAVIDGLEVVDIGQHHRKGPARLAGLPRAAGEVESDAPVVETCKGSRTAARRLRCHPVDRRCTAATVSAAEQPLRAIDRHRIRTEVQHLRHWTAFWVPAL